MSTPPPILDTWLSATTDGVRKHRKVLLRERDGRRKAILPQLRKRASQHYVSPETTAKRLAQLGAPKTAELLRRKLPKTKRARSGDLGEILATEFVNENLDFDVPIRRLQWKDGREMPLRGDDIIGVAQDDRAGLRLLKGEAKSRATLSLSVVNEAAKALSRNRNRPDRQAVLFVAERLRELGEEDSAMALEETVLAGFRGADIEHLLFAFSGNDPDSHLADYLDAHKKRKLRRHAIGLQVEDHGNFVRELYEGI